MRHKWVNICQGLRSVSGTASECKVNVCCFCCCCHSLLKAPCSLSTKGKTGHAVLQETHLWDRMGSINPTSSGPGPNKNVILYCEWYFLNQGHWFPWTKLKRSVFYHYIRIFAIPNKWSHLIFCFLISQWFLIFVVMDSFKNLMKTMNLLFGTVHTRLCME